MEQNQSTSPWSCGNCGTANLYSASVCVICGFHKDTYKDVENYNKAMGIKPGVPTASCKPYKDPKESTPESTLNVIAAIILWAGIIISAVLLIVGLASIDGRNDELVAPLLLSVIPILIPSIVTYGVLRVLCNISNNLREINRKTK